MVLLISWSLLCYGFTNILVYGKIFESFRELLDRKNKFLGDLFSCPMCLSVWIGFLVSLVVWSPVNVMFHVPTYHSWFFDGILASGVVWVINSIIEFFEENRIK